MTTYKETFVTFPVTTAQGDEELTISAHKVKTLRGNKRQTVVTYEDGERIERVTVPEAVDVVRSRVMSGLVDWA